MHDRAITSEYGFQLDLLSCENLMRDGSKSFFSASRILPSNIRDSAIALYAFCRLLDDMVDDQNASDNVIEQIEYRLDRIYAQNPLDIPADRALALVVDRFLIPRDLLEALVEGFKWDRTGRQYQTIEELCDYAARVASTVGVMMTLIMGIRDRAVLERACELGLAMQLTNIARDVGEDARNQRLYLPRAWLEEENIDPDQWLKNPVFNDGILRVNQRLIKYADDLYERSAYGFSGLPRNCRSAIAAASLIYSEIGRQIERQGMDSISKRAVVSKKRKVLLLLKSLGAAIYSVKPIQKLDTIPAVQFLVDAVEPEEQYAHYSGSVEDRLIWVVSLLEKVEHRKIDAYHSLARH
ncbi:phytoene/squalene synthase family protein [Polynucleobacter paneuropaeus]|nr:phytoene/squalene synthase family protein [Polynucleobacter paneuropaeus]MBT8522113.1 phytoene/squalene synthase family protein [Polynucleobacter paneuropaeus]MBT8538352.1 phytoene/squalene synthase family protein [Polynucleobacter paneuropaeus]RAZ46106.1 phytoene/squalene synthase family protein [Polynucleobacter paneuropaeus]